jgi:hypothetical protein
MGDFKYSSLGALTNHDNLADNSLTVEDVSSIIQLGDEEWLIAIILRKQSGHTIVIL